MLLEDEAEPLLALRVRDRVLQLSPQDGVLHLSSKVV
jgi:hypothetical protein